MEYNLSTVCLICVDLANCFVKRQIVYIRLSNSRDFYSHISIPS